MSVPNDARLAARKLVAEALDRPLEAIPPDAAIGGIRTWDSLGHVRILLAIEAAIGRPLPSEAIASVANVEDIARILADAR